VLTTTAGVVTVGAGRGGAVGAVTVSVGVVRLASSGPVGLAWAGAICTVMGLSSGKRVSVLIVTSPAAVRTVAVPSLS
jgi:hypothetical protein